MTRQEIFDTVIKQMHSQGWKQSRDGANCVYRSNSGMKCAAGALIKDEFYEYAIERKMVASTPVASALRNSGVPDEEMDFVARLQDCHDQHVKPEDMEEDFRFLAKQNGLTFPELR